MQSLRKYQKSYKKENIVFVFIYGVQYLENVVTEVQCNAVEGFCVLPFRKRFILFIILAYLPLRCVVDFCVVVDSSFRWIVA